MKKFKCAMFILIGLLSLILSFACFMKDVGKYEPELTYGGDAYTGIQNAAAQAANNTVKLAKIVQFGFGSILFISGLSLIFAGFPVSEKKEPIIINPPKEESDDRLPEL